MSSGIFKFCLSPDNKNAKIFFTINIFFINYNIDINNNKKYIKCVYHFFSQAEF